MVGTTYAPVGSPICLLAIATAVPCPPAAGTTLHLRCHLPTLNTCAEVAACISERGEGETGRANLNACELLQVGTDGSQRASATSSRGCQDEVCGLAANMRADRAARFGSDVDIGEAGVGRCVVVAVCAYSA